MNDALLQLFYEFASMAMSVSCPLVMQGVPIWYLHAQLHINISILPWAYTQFNTQKMCVTVSSHLTYNNMVYDQLLYWSVEETYGQKYIA